MRSKIKITSNIVPSMVSPPSEKTKRAYLLATPQDMSVTSNKPLTRKFRRRSVGFRTELRELLRLRRHYWNQRRGMRASGAGRRCDTPRGPGCCEAARLALLELIAMTTGRSLMIFDVEGTLVESTGLILRCWQETLQSFGFEFPLTVLQRHSAQDPHDMLHELLPGPHLTRVLRSHLHARSAHMV